MHHFLIERKPEYFYHIFYKMRPIMIKFGVYSFLNKVTAVL